MAGNVIRFPARRRSSANDDRPDGPGGGTAISPRALRRCARIVRSLRGFSLAGAERGRALAA